MTAVCSVGIDMVVIPGDTTAEVISGLIADEAATQDVTFQSHIHPENTYKNGHQLLSDFSLPY